MTKTVARSRSRSTRPVATSPKTFPPQKNQWTILNFEDIVSWQNKHKLSNSALCRILDVGYNSYYSWKHNRCAPSTGLQHKMLKIIEQDNPVDPKYVPSMTVSKQEIQESFEEKQSIQQPIVRDGDVAMEVEIAAIQATAAIICSRLETGMALKDTQLIQLAGNIQQALLGDF